MLQLLCALKVMIVTLVSGLLSVVMPSHIQRALFITTLYVQLTKENILQEATLDRLNRRLALASVDSSLEFNAAWTDVVWFNVDIRKHLEDKLGPNVLKSNHQLTYDELTVACGFIADQCPKCLQYGNRTQRISDIRNLLTCPIVNSAY